MNTNDIIKNSTDELVQLILNDTILASKVYGLRRCSNKELSKLCKEAYKKYKSITKDNRNKKKIDLYKSREEKWNEKYPNSFRFRSPEEICNIIKNNESALTLAWNYVSPCKVNSKLNPDLIERTRQGLILYYKSFDASCYKLNKLIR